MKIMNDKTGSNDESIPEGFVRGMLKNINRIKIKKSL